VTDLQRAASDLGPWTASRGTTSIEAMRDQLHLRPAADEPRSLGWLGFLGMLGFTGFQNPFAFAFFAFFVFFRYFLPPR
jgi:hypothetical protein